MYIVLLKKIKEMSGVNDLTEIWPNLELFMHGGINFSPYKKQFYDLYPSSKLNYLEIYNASEGFFGIKNAFEKVNKHLSSGKVFEHLTKLQSK